MADAILKCKHCGENTEHMHLSGKVCICSECGEKNDAPNWREIVAAVEARKAGNIAEVARQQGAPLVLNTMGAASITPEQQAQLAARYFAGEEMHALAKEYGVSNKVGRGYVAQARDKARKSETVTPAGETKPSGSETNNPKEETMKTKLTDEKIAEIRADYAALPEDQRTPAARRELADKHGVSMPTFMKYTKLMESKPAKAPAGGRKGGRRVKAPRPEGRAPKAGGLKAAILAMVEAAVEKRMAALEKRVEQLAESRQDRIDIPDLDKQVEAALARALK